jgi:hypothetical protein
MSFLGASYNPPDQRGFYRCFPFTGGTQEANLTGLIDHEEVFERVAFALATIVLLLLLGIAQTMDGSLSTLMPKRGLCPSAGKERC